MNDAHPSEYVQVDKKVVFSLIALFKESHKPSVVFLFICNSAMRLHERSYLVLSYRHREIM